MKFSTKLCALFSAIIIIMGTGISFFVYFSNVKTLEAHIEDRLKNQTFHTMDKIDMMLFERYGDIRTLASDHIISSRKSTPKQITERLLEFKKSYRHYFSLSFFDLNRVRIADTEGKDIGRQHALSEYWTEISGGKSFTYNISTSESINMAVLYFASVVKDGNRVPFGVVVSRVPIESLYEIVRQGVGIYNIEKDFLIELVDKDGRIIYSNHDREAILKATSPDWVLISESVKKGEKTGVVKHTHSTEKRGAEILVFASEQGYEDFKGSDWMLITEVPTKIAFASAVELRNRIFVISLIISFFAFVAARLLSSRISGTIERLSAATDEVAKGNLDVKVDVTTTDETGRLAEAFNRMTTDLKEQKDKLLSYSRELEAKVLERTAELTEANELLEKSEAAYYALINQLPLTVWIYKARLDETASTIYISPQIESLGFSQEEWINGRDYWSRQLHPDDRDRVLAVFKRLRASDVPFGCEYRLLTRDNKIRWFRDEAVVINDDVGNPLFFQGVMLDITERKNAEEALQQKKDLLQAIIDNSTAVIYIKDLDGRLVLVNKWVENNIHLSKGELLGKTDHDILPKDIADTFRNNDIKVIECRHPVKFEEVVLLDGEPHTYISIKFPLLDSSGNPYAVCGISTDITERKQMEEQIRKSLEEKELLLKEVNHRVKGNLQVIISMLKLQEKHIKSEEISDVFKEIENRIRVIGLVHEKLYQSEDLSNINFSGYIKSIVRGLFTSYGATASRVLIKTEIDNVFLGIDRAIPIGMIVNELISNSLRHAFPENSSGEIQIILRKNGDSHELIVKDNGIGMPEELDFRNPGTLGLQLINILVKQIGGTIDLNSAEGTEFHIRLTV